MTIEEQTEAIGLTEMSIPDICDLAAAFAGDNSEQVRDLITFIVGRLRDERDASIQRERDDAQAYARAQHAAGYADGRAQGRRQAALELKPQPAAIEEEIEIVRPVNGVGERVIRRRSDGTELVQDVIRDLKSGRVLALRKHEDE